jgi:ketosteroid isomerase-like protein
MAELLSDMDTVLSANLEFYRAFNARSYPAMAALWARSAPVACVHPGWTAIAGREQVLESWRAILANPDAPHVMCHDDRAFLYGDVAIVQCEEELESGHLVATNIFVREGDGWKLIHHQASPLLARGDEDRRRRRPPTRH